MKPSPANVWVTRTDHGGDLQNLVMQIVLLSGSLHLYLPPILSPFLIEPHPDM